MSADRPRSGRARYHPARDSPPPRRRRSRRARRRVARRCARSGRGSGSGRLLAATPRRRRRRGARARRDRGTARYVGVGGRIDAEEEFEDADHRPLVLRRTRLEAARRRRWRTFEDDREAVPVRGPRGPRPDRGRGDALDAGPRRRAPRVDRDRRRPAPTACRTGIAAGDAGPAPDRAVSLGRARDRARRARGRRRRTAPSLTRRARAPARPDDPRAAEAMRSSAGGRHGRPSRARLLAGGLALVVAGLVWAVVDALR